MKELVPMDLKYCAGRAEQGPKVWKVTPSCRRCKAANHGAACPLTSHVLHVSFLLDAKCILSMQLLRLQRPCDTHDAVPVMFDTGKGEVEAKGCSHPPASTLDVHPPVYRDDPAVTSIYTRGLRLPASAVTPAKSQHVDECADGDGRATAPYEWRQIQGP